MIIKNKSVTEWLRFLYFVVIYYLMFLYIGPYALQALKS